VQCSSNFSKTALTPGQGYSKSRDISRRNVRPGTVCAVYLAIPGPSASPIVQVHAVVWKGEAAELWVKRRAPLNPSYVPGRDFEHVLVGALAMGSCYTYRVGRIAGEVAVFDSQGPAVPDRSAVLQEICTQQLVQNGKARDFEHFCVRALAMRSYYTYVHGGQWIAVE
jgi:hypothetical protein